MISNLAGAGVSVPGGFATTAQAYRDFLELSASNAQIHAALDALDVAAMTSTPWPQTGAQIRQWIMEAEFPEKLNEEIRRPSPPCRPQFRTWPSPCVRSSPKILPDAFAGQQETFLNIRGAENVIRRAKEVFRLAVQRPADASTGSTRVSTSWWPCCWVQHAGAFWNRHRWRMSTSIPSRLPHGVYHRRSLRPG